MYEFLLVMGVVLWLGIGFLYVRSGLATIYHPATYYMFFHGFIFVIRPIVGYIIGYTFIYRLYDFNPSIEIKEMVLLAADLGFVCFMAAACRVGNTQLILRPTRFSRYDTQRSERAALIPTSIVLGPIGVAALVYWYRIAAGGEFTMVQSAARTMVNTETTGYFTSATDFVGALGILIAWQYRFRLIAMLPFLAYVVVRAASGSARWSFILTTASLCIFYLYDRKRRWPEWRTVLIGCVVLAAFVTLGEQRDFFISYFRGIPLKQNMFGLRFLEGMDFGNLEYFEFIAWTIPQKTGTYGYFLDNLQLLTEPIPRIMWPAKPFGPPIQMWDLFDYGNPIGMSSSLPGMGWAQLGYVGVALWCGLAGALAGKLYNWFVRSEQTGFQVGIYLMLLPISIQVYRDGGVMTMLKFSLYFFITVGVWKVFSKIFNRQGRSAQSFDARHF